jgi:hypothetical protein
MKKILLVFCIVILNSWAYAANNSDIRVSILGNDLNVELPENSYSEMCKLYLVWNETDCGDDISKWPKDNRLEYGGTLKNFSSVYRFDALGIPANVKFRIDSVSDKAGFDLVQDAGGLRLLYSPGMQVIVR